MNRYLIITLLIAAVVLAAAPSHAQVDAQAVFSEARDLFQEEKYDAALAGFEKALAASGSPNARLYVARCLRELGRLGEAYTQLVAARADAAARAAEEAQYETTRDVADAELRQLEPRIAKLVISVPASVTGVSVAIDGKAISEARIGEALPLVPGDHRLVATAPGHETIRTTVALTAGHTKTLPVFMASARAREPAPDPEPTTQDNGSALQTAGFVVGGVGIVGVAVGAAFGGLALAKKGDVEDNCDGLACNTEGADAASTGNVFGNISTAGFVLGGVALATGITLLLLSGDDDSDTAGIGYDSLAYWRVTEPLTIRW